MLEEGKSWSGRERNLGYLNTRDGSFTDISTIAGLAHASDSRALGLTDWDGDGDLDLWQANRSTPRVRFLLNQLADHGRSLQLRLTGTRCNRDAIGTRVTVKLSTGQQLIKTLRAGEGYLSQSSKTMHFGIPEKATVQSVAIRWPGSSPPEVHEGLEPGNLYHFTEQSKTPIAIRSLNPPLALDKASASADFSASSNTSLRLVPHAKLPLPELRFQSLPDGVPASVADLKQPTLVLLWASWCRPCLHEIRDLSQSAEALAQAGLKVLLVNVDDTPQSIDDAPASFRQGAATEAFLDAFDVTQRVLTGRERTTALPTSFLTDGQDRLIALYKGPVSTTTVLQDLSLLQVTDSAFRDQAVPFPGRWLIKSMPPDLLAVPDRLLQLGRAGLAFRYLEKHITGSAPAKTKAELPSLSLTMGRVSATYAEVGRRWVNQQRFDDARKTYVRALQYTPRHLESRAQLAILYEEAGDLARASTQFREILKLQPNHLPAQNSLAWILATAPDPQLRRPEEAERLATQVCQATNHAMPEPLDTLAAAQAAGGKFREAAATVKKALALLESNAPQRPGATENLQQRLKLYEQGKPYRQSTRD